MKIDYSASIKAGRITPVQNNWLDYFELAFFFFVNYIIFLGFLLLAPLQKIASALNRQQADVSDFVFLSPFFLLGTYFLFCLAKWRKLTKIEGYDIETNKEIFVQIIAGLYPDLHIDWDGNVLIASKAYDNWEFSLKGGKEIITIFQGNTIHINMISTYRAGPNPWFAYTNESRVLKIMRVFKEKSKHKATG